MSKLFSIFLGSLLLFFLSVSHLPAIDAEAIPQVQDPFASEVGEDSPIPMKRRDLSIEDLLLQLQMVVPQDYMTTVPQVRKKIEIYLEKKRKVCEGVFASFILEDSTTKGAMVPARPLTKSERNQCYRELVTVQSQYIRFMFAARKNYLNHLHQLQMRELENDQNELLKNLEDQFHKAIARP